MLPHETRILHRGSWSFDQPTPCQLLGVHEALAHLSEEESSLLNELVLHKAVLFEWDRAFDADHGTYDPEHLVTFDGQQIPNRELWDLLHDDPPERPTPEWETWALLVVDSPFHTIMEQPLYADTVEHGNTSFPVIALRVQHPDDEPPDETIPQGWIRTSAPFLAQHVQPMNQGWSFVPNIAVAPSAPPDMLRDWSWGWSQTCGPVRLTVGVQRSAQELKEWLDGLEMRGYEPVKLSVDSGRPDLHVLLPGRVAGLVGPAYTPDDEGDLRLFPKVDGWSGADGVLTLFDGRFQIWRSFHTPNRMQEAAENSILDGLLRGELGEVEWDLFDGDWYAFDAQGPSLQSLRDYLDPRRDSQISRASWNLKSAEIDCREDTTWIEVLRRVAAHFGVHGRDENLRADLEAYFAPLRAGQYPRRVTMVLPDDLSVHSGSAEIQPRGTSIVWSFSTAPHGAGPTASSSCLPP